MKKERERKKLFFLLSNDTQRQGDDFAQFPVAVQILYACCGTEWTIKNRHFFFRDREACVFLFFASIWTQFAAILWNRKKRTILEREKNEIIEALHEIIRNYTRKERIEFAFSKNMDLWVRSASRPRRFGRYSGRKNHQKDALYIWS